MSYHAAERNVERVALKSLPKFQPQVGSLRLGIKFPLAAHHRKTGLFTRPQFATTRLICTSSSLITHSTQIANMSDNGEVEVEVPSVTSNVLPKEVTAEIGSVKLFNKWSYEDVEIRDISLTYDPNRCTHYFDREY